MKRLTSRLTKEDRQIILEEYAKRNGKYSLLHLARVWLNMKMMAEVIYKPIAQLAASHERLMSAGGLE